jgi:hypothetical protein
MGGLLDRSAPTRILLAADRFVNSRVGEFARFLVRAAKSALWWRSSRRYSVFNQDV